MSAQSILVGQIFVVFTTIILGVWFATQWTAAQFAYDVYLGTPWFTLGGTPIYYPWRLFEWWYAFDAYAPHIFSKGGRIAAGSGFLGCVFAIIGSVWRGRQAKRLTTYGSSRWASDKDLKQAGLLKPAGVFLGKTDCDYLRHNGPEHVMAFAPTRSGKGVGLVVPTLLSWTESAVIHDIKGENWERIGRLHQAGAPHSPIACSLIRPILQAPNTIHCLKCARAATRFAMFKTLPTFWLIQKVRLSAEIIGRRPDTLFWSARFSMFSTQKKKRHSHA